jgi:hypothetical protein
MDRLISAKLVLAGIIALVVVNLIALRSLRVTRYVIDCYTQGRQ